MAIHKYETTLALHRPAAADRHNSEFVKWIGEILHNAAVMWIYIHHNKQLAPYRPAALTATT
jgi:hypothetical protein